MLIVSMPSMFASLPGTKLKEPLGVSMRLIAKDFRYLNEDQ